MVSAQRSIAIIGVGPRGAGIYERIVANAAELYPDRPIALHVIDPFPFGAGRVWRHEQSELLRLNSLSRDVTLFTDDSVRIDGPISHGPSLSEWAQSGGAPEVDDDTFATRQQASKYMEWAFQRAKENAPANVVTHEHSRSAVRIEEVNGRSQVWLDGVDEPIVADVVFFTQGHLDAAPRREHQELADYATENGLTFVPPAYTGDEDWSVLPAGEQVLVRGFGLAAVDLFVLVMEGRGGRFHHQDGRLRYEKSGREPILHFGSGRGVPYHSKITYHAMAPHLPQVVHFTDDVVEKLLAKEEPLSLDEDVFPFMDKEISHAFHQELARTESTTPQQWDRKAYDQPLAGLAFADSDALQEHLRDYIEKDLARRSNPEYSPDQAIFYRLLAIFQQFGKLLAAEKLIAADAKRFFGFFSYFASGPPPRRLRELLALADAGVVRFLGPDIEIRATDGEFAAVSPAVPGAIRARVLVEARLPDPSVLGNRDALVRSLADSGAIREKDQTGRIDIDPGSHPIAADGTVHENWYAFGANVGGFTVGAFSRPRSNALPFRQNDNAAREALTQLSHPNVGR